MIEIHAIIDVGPYMLSDLLLPFKRTSMSIHFVPVPTVVACDECHQPSICYPVEVDPERRYCLPCWYRAGDPGVTISDAAMATGETVWCDDKGRPHLFGCVGVCLSMLAAWAPQRDVSLLNALARLSASTDVVRWSVIRPRITGVPKHPRCVHPVGTPSERSARFRVNTADWVWSGSSSTEGLVKAALCTDYNTWEDVAAQPDSLLVPFYTLGNFALAQQVESRVVLVEGVTDAQSCATVVGARLTAACILGDRGLFYGNVKHWSNECRSRCDEDMYPIKHAISQCRREFLEALVATGEPITTEALYAFSPEATASWMKHVLHLAARQEHGDNIAPEDRPKLKIIDAFSG